jgi:hypothetical protein
MTLIGNAAQLPSTRRRKLLREMHFASGMRGPACPRMGNASIWARYRDGLRFTVIALNVGQRMRDVLRTFLRRLHSVHPFPREFSGHFPSIARNFLDAIRLAFFAKS